MVSCDLHTDGLEHLSSEGEGGFCDSSLCYHLTGELSLVTVFQVMDEEATGALRVVHLKVVTL